MAYKFNEIKLDKGMYSERGKSFAQILEQLDPSENYKGTAYEGLDAYQRQLKRFDIKVKGSGSDCVEKFFSTSESSVLFPEYVARSVRTGVEENNIIPNIVASVTKIDGMDYRSIYSAATDEDKALSNVEEGAEIPTTEIKSSANLVSLKKRGRMLVASYEAIRFQRLDLFSVMLRQIGNHIAAMHVKDAVGVVINGDGNANSSRIYSVGQSPIGGTSGTLSYAEMLAFWNEFEGYNLNTILATPGVMMKILSCPEFQNPLTGLNFMGTGEPGSPMGAKLIRCSALEEGTLIGMDKNYALEMVTAGDISVEYDRLIDKQLERAAITSISGFAKLYKDASKVLCV